MAAKKWGLIIIIMINLVFSCFASSLWGMDSAREKTGEEVFINQVGYLTNAPKFVISAKAAGEFVIFDEKEKSIFQGALEPFADPTSMQTVWRGDFSSQKIPGVYRIFIPEVGWSYPFTIDHAVYNQVLALGTRYYYLQRCGIVLNDDSSGLSHPLCHRQDGVMARADAFNQKGDIIPSMGGWHDAGDYGKYTTTTTVTVAQLLAAYQLWPEKFVDGQFGIPESGNGRPDLLDEARVGIEWLFTMQRPDGAVYHKLSGRYWPNIGTSPDFDRQPRYIYGISTADTGKFAATMAIVARVFQGMDPDLAERAEQAAKKAWEFLAENEFIWDHSGFDDQGSGAYGTTDDWPDRIWAAMELGVLTGDDSYVSAVINEENTFRRPYQPTPISWSDGALLGLFHYACEEGGRPELRAELTAMIIKLADHYLAAVDRSGYRYTLKFNEFAWASNKEALSRGITMLLAAELKANPQYQLAALAQLDFVLGFNPLSQCYVAGLGTKTVKSPHHRLVVASSKSVPGLLVGGPNNQAESGVEPRDRGPFSYQDATPSYSSNETAIDYNAALVFVASAFAATPE